MVALDAVVCNPPYVALEARESLPAGRPGRAGARGLRRDRPLRAALLQAFGARAGRLVAVEIEESTAEAVSKAAEREGFEALAVRQDLPGATGS